MGLARVQQALGLIRPQRDAVPHGIARGGVIPRVRIVGRQIELEEAIEISSPDEFVLMHNYPNPFNPSTTIEFAVAEKSNVMLTVFNSIGEKVSVLINEQREPGAYKIDFSAKELTSGIYYYRLETDNFVQTRKMILLR